MIDAHHHLLDPRRRHYPWLTADQVAINRPRTEVDLEPMLRAQGVTATVLVQTIADGEETRDLLQAATRRPWIAGVVGWVDLTAGDVAAQIADLKASPGGDRLVGLRHNLHDETDPRWILRPAVLDGLAAVAKAGLTFDLLVRPRELPPARAAVRQLPGLQFVLDHAGKPPIATAPIDNWKHETELLASHPNVACKLSGLVTEAAWATWTLDDLRPAVEHIRRRFGADRLMFGSDWPVCELAADYGRVCAAARRLAGDDWTVIADETARRVYGLTAPVAVPSGRSEDTSVTPS